MEPNILCSEDSSPALYACFCRFPLSTVCESCLVKHPMDTELPQHFHLPISAAQLIKTKQIKDQYRQWIYNLHGAYNTLKANEDNMTRFEEELEAARQETLLQFEDELNARCAAAKATLARLKTLFQTELQRALHEVCQHAVEQWKPEANSLAGLMWDYDGASPLSLFRFWTGKTQDRLSHAFQIVAETAFPTFLPFNGPMDGTEQHGQMSPSSRERREQAEARRRIAVLEGEKAALIARNRDLQNSYQQELADKVKASEAQLKQIAAEKEGIMREIAGKVKRLSKELATVKGEGAPAGKTSCEGKEAVSSEKVLSLSVKEATIEKGAFPQRLAEKLVSESEITPPKTKHEALETPSTSGHQSPPQIAQCKLEGAAESQPAPSGGQVVALTSGQLRYFIVQSCKWSAPLILDRKICCDSRSSYSVLDANRVVSCGSTAYVDVGCTSYTAPTKREAYLIHVSAGQCRVQDLPLLNQQRWSPGLLPYRETVFVFGCKFHTAGEL